MYPNIIVRYNISPETMHCTCGDDIEVPEAGWTICRRRGLIPLGLEPVLRRRLELKRLMKAETDPAKRHEYDLRQRALKNILVTCFGYLGFKNFIFSNVECKECVFLLGRHILERTKGIAEEEGLEVLYGIVDSIFVKDGSRCDYERFVGRASGEFGFALELDCIFSSIAFPSSSDGSGVANKYYGITATNKIEARGISLRHSDSPQFIKEFQEKAIRAILGDGEAGLAAGGHDGSAGMACGESGGRGTEAGGSESGARERERNLTKKLCAIVEEYENKLLERGFALEQLAITRSVTKTEYKANQPHVLAYRQAPDGKGHVTFVFTVYGPKPVHMARIEEIDCAQYVRLLRMSVDELLLGISDRA
jgi:DNA polymerase elongation subunit (family B)